MFEPIAPRESAVDTCARALRRAIMGGELAPGVRLPPERTLAASFGVNRVTVRGALARLATSRLLSVRQGSGYVVRDFRTEGGPDLIAGLAELADGAELGTIAADLLFVRRHLARAVLTRLADKSQIDATGIRDAVDGFADAVALGKKGEELARADLAIVGAMLDATGSPVLRLCMNPVQQVLARLPRLRDAIYADPNSNLVAWRALVAWLVERDVALIEPIVAELARRDALTVDRLQQEAP